MQLRIFKAKARQFLRPSIPTEIATLPIIRKPLLNYVLSIPPCHWHNLVTDTPSVNGMHLTTQPLSLPTFFVVPGCFYFTGINANSNNSKLTGNSNSTTNFLIWKLGHLGRNGIDLNYWVRWNETMVFGISAAATKARVVRAPVCLGMFCIKKKTDLVVEIRTPRVPFSTPPQI